jgi:hypothetical protein
VSFTPYLRVVAAPRESDFLPGVISPEVREFDPGTGLRYDDDAAWRSTDSTWTTQTWPCGKKRRFKFRIPPPLLPREGTYQCRIQFGELEEVDENQFATLTNSYFYVPVPFRLHSSTTAVPLIAAGVAALSAVLSVLAAVVSTVAG